jgi:outer membrane protein OmpA-like peptidoglycan-associated protein
MKHRLVFIVATMFLLTAPGMFAQLDDTYSSVDVAFWVRHWAQPRVVLFGPEEEAFNENMHVITFPWDGHDEPSNPAVLDDNVQWLKGHPSVRFYIDGYASSRGELIYNLLLSERRANWVKRILVEKGISENRIVVAAGWGQLYPVCPELNDECWTKNRLVRFSYSPD